MSTILFHSIVFGPIKSRRLGNSLGVNLLPQNGKICSFDCVYCECGWNKDGAADHVLPPKEAVFEQMSTKFALLHAEGTPVDTITFSGNGEPTIHPDFPEIIDFTLKMRDKYFPNAAVSVLSNATMIGKKEVREALMKVTNPILKIDSGLEEYIRIVNKPVGHYSLQETVDNLKKFNGNFILQTMFLRGNIDGRRIDLTSPDSVEPWRKIVLDLRPREVMMYTLDRETPAKELEKVTVEEMETIAAPLREAGITVQIRG
ncbi:MAG TPA: radical SAM protein [Candidatus Coprenecus stercoravium]|uniref:Radical SAM protein n=1 Tax=Candidatus Coprenecus stercoravium TaxID=2840735 RepID=A0A9D2K9D9_9BACT|nr:radical SAM protein [Candidatus Coprenecus stercoravium]